MGMEQTDRRTDGSQHCLMPPYGRGIQSGTHHIAVTTAAAAAGVSDATFELGMSGNAISTRIRYSHFQSFPGLFLLLSQAENMFPFLSVSVPMKLTQHIRVVVFLTWMTLFIPNGFVTL